MTKAKLLGALLGTLFACVLAGPASATTILHPVVLDPAAAAPKLQVNSQGIALVLFKTDQGATTHILAWGAVNGAPHPTDPPSSAARFNLDFSGGWKSQKNAKYWQTFKNACRPYDGPPLVMFVAACKAPDGSYWALQAWQRNLPIRGFDPWTSAQKAFELQLSHWTGDLPVLEIYQQWSYGGANEGFFGRMLYQGEPVFGNRSASVDRFARQIYIDTLNPPKYGAGWRRDTAISVHVRNGGFCYTWVAQSPPGGYPGTKGGYPSDEPRGPGIGDRYRVTAMGPGVTPIVQWEEPRIGPFNQAARDERVKLFDGILGGDAHCARER